MTGASGAGARWEIDRKQMLLQPCCPNLIVGAIGSIGFKEGSHLSVDVSSVPDIILTGSA